MRGHLFDELRDVVQARYPINAKHRAGTFPTASTEDEFDRVLPVFGVAENRGWWFWGPPNSARNVRG